jgi:hypothetical protein
MEEKQKDSTTIKEAGGGSPKRIPGDRCRHKHVVGLIPPCNQVPANGGNT